MAEGHNNRRDPSQEDMGIRYIRQSDPEYPEKLRMYRGMPKGLYLIGRLPREDLPTVAIVGARRSDSYGDELARSFGAALTAAGVQILSGMAWGIDGMAHRGALEAGGDTFAVLGCGVDVCYPAGHRRLYDQIRTYGGILSEQPPGMPPLPGNFPARNRIISALSDLVLIVEAKEKSGSLITADFALEQGKDVYAVPGRVGDTLSQGCLNLIRQGAGVADSPGAILEALGLSERIPGISHEGNQKILLAKDENIVYSWLRLQPTTLDELAGHTGWPVPRVLSVLTSLQIKGCIREIRKNSYVKIIT